MRLAADIHCRSHHPFVLAVAVLTVVVGCLVGSPAGAAVDLIPARCAPVSVSATLDSVVPVKLSGQLCNPVGGRPRRCNSCCMVGATTVRIGISRTAVELFLSTCRRRRSRCAPASLVCSHCVSPARAAAPSAQIMAARRPLMISLASRTILSISSTQVGMSAISPCAWLAHHIPSAVSP